MSDEQAPKAVKKTAKKKVSNETNDLVFPKQKLNKFPVNDVVDYLVERVGSERIKKIAGKFKEEYAKIDRLTEEEARQVLGELLAKNAESKLLAMRDNNHGR